MESGERVAFEIRGNKKNEVLNDHNLQSESENPLMESFECWRIAYFPFLAILKASLEKKIANSFLKFPIY